MPQPPTRPIHVLNGPNLNLLGVREPSVYGSETLADLERRSMARAESLGHTVLFRQSNHEGVLVDWVHEAREQASALVLNPAGYGHTSVALHDALRTVGVPVVECHLSNPAAREAFRHHSYVSLVADGVVSGFGGDSYDLAIEAAARLIARRAAV